MRQTAVFSYLLFFCIHLSAQSPMRIHHKNGTHWDVQVAQIDRISFLDGDTIPSVSELSDSWLWGDSIAGYFEI